MDFEEEEWDLNKKAYLHELRRSNIEKRVILGMTLLFIISWFTIIQGKLIENGEYQA